MSIDFTLTIYRKLLSAIKQSGYAFYTFEEWCRGEASGRYVILRHDVDSKAGNSLTIAGIEAEMGIRATYYFRIVPRSNQPEIIRAIAKLGHEIGYHYEDLSLFRGDMEKAYEHFKIQLAYFRQFYPVQTICMHGSPTSKWDNRDLWNSYSYRDLGIIGEPYLDFLNEPEINYFTDTARMWDGTSYNVRDKQQVSKEQQSVDKESTPNPQNIITPSGHSIHSTSDLIEWFETKPAQHSIMITTHPQRWTDNSAEWFMEIWKQYFKNKIKKLLIIING